MRRVALAVLVLLAGCSDDTTPRDGAAADQPRTEAGQPFDLGDGAVADGPALDAAATDRGPVDGAPGDGAPSAHGPCPKLGAASGTITNVQPGQAQQLPSIVASAKAGTTILLADGTYKMTGTESQRRLTFATPNVTLRSASGNREKVIIDGEYKTNEIIFIKADDVTVADLTLTHAVDHLVHVTGGSATIKGTLLYNLQLVDAGEQLVKVNSDGQGHYADQGRLECSRLEMTAQGRPHIETNPGGCYTGGIDAHSAWGWKVRFNRFEGIYCDNGSLAEHAIHFWSASRDTLAERNVIVDCARGIGFGLGQTGADRTYADDPYPTVGYMGHVDGIIRNNVIHAGAAVSQYFDTGIELNQAHGVRVYHNTVVSKPTFSSIDYRFANTKAEIRNNLTFKITVRDGAQGTVDHNLQSTPAALFINAAAVDYHLTPGAGQALDKGVTVSEAGLDMDGEPHAAGPPDLGADEL